MRPCLVIPLPHSHPIGVLTKRRVATCRDCNPAEQTGYRRFYPPINPACSRDRSRPYNHNPPPFKQLCDNRHIVGSRPVATATQRNKLNIRCFTSPSTPPAVATGRDPTTTNLPPSKQSCDNRHIVGSRPVATATQRNKLNIRRFTSPSTPLAVATGRDPTTTTHRPNALDKC